MGRGNPQPFNVPDDTPWRDEETLRRLYVEEGHSCQSAADVLGCSADTVHKWLKKHGIERRPPTSERPPHYYISNKGYERVKSGTEEVRVHRLAAVAWFGLDAVISDDDNPNARDTVIHHRNGIPWDNRESNLELMSHGEHSKVEKPWEFS